MFGILTFNFYILVTALSFKLRFSCLFSMSLSKMTEIELYDVEEYKVYKFPVSQENYSEIIAGDLELASNLLNEQKLKNNYLAAFQFMKEASNVVSEKPLNMSAPSTSGLSLENENNEREDPAGELTAERMMTMGIKATLVKCGLQIL